MKLLYIALCDLNNNAQIGIKKKIHNQLNSFQKEYDTYLITQMNWFYTIYHGDRLVEKKVLLTFEDIYEDIFHFIETADIKMVYIRYLRSNLWLMNMLKKLRKIRVKVVLEFPTVPYDVEIQGTTELVEDLLFRKKLKKYVSMSTNYNGLKSVFGIPSIPLQNGIDPEGLPEKKENQSEDITLLAVATMNFWHGYDRLIKGLADYYRQNESPAKVKLVLVGTGSQSNSYKNLVERYQLGEQVEFKGSLFGEELDKEFDRADIAVGTLGMFRNNAEEASPIKTKEYCLRGIPIILGHKDLAFEDKLPFIHRVPNDESAINIHEVVQFYIHYKEKCSGKDIRLYAEKNLTWDKLLKPVIKFFNDRS